MAVADAHVSPGFLTLVRTQISFQSHRLLFSHASAGERRKYAGKKFCLEHVSNSQPPGHESDTLTTEPSGRGEDYDGENMLSIVWQPYSNNSDVTSGRKLGQIPGVSFSHAPYILAFYLHVQTDLLCVRLTLSQAMNFRLSQSERVGRRQL